MNIRDNFTQSNCKIMSKLNNFKKLTFKTVQVYNRTLKIISILSIELVLNLNALVSIKDNIFVELEKYLYLSVILHYL